MNGGKPSLRILSKERRLMKTLQAFHSKLGVLLLLGLLTGASSANAVIALNVNSLTVFESLEMTSANIQGPVAAGGDLTGSATLVTSNGFTSAYTVQVAGNINTTDVEVQNGSLLYGGAFDRTGLNDNQLDNFYQGDQSAMTSLIDSYKADALAASVAYGNLTASANASFSTANNALSLNLAEGDDYGIIHLSLTDLSGLSSMTYNLSGTGALIINVAGDTVDIKSGINFTGWTDSEISRVLWNFYEAESLTISSSFRGSILAPNAELTTNAEIAGGVVVESAIINNAINLPNFDGSLSLPAIPEASHYALLTGMSMLLLAFGRRRQMR